MKATLISRLVGGIFFAMISAMLGYWTLNIGFYSGNSFDYIIIFTAIGLITGLIITPSLTVFPFRKMYQELSELSGKRLVSVVLGFLIAVIGSALLTIPLSKLPGILGMIIPIMVTIGLCYVGVAVFAQHEFDLNKFSFTSANSSEGLSDLDLAPPERSVLLDTSVVIDGRIADIARTGFVPGTLLIPNFVLNELQFIADSGDALRRQRGRRGLEVLGNMQKDSLISVKITSVDVEGTNAVDEKLVILAKQMHSPILTNDYNLNRVAEIQGVEILNINELANAIKTVFLPGETLNIRVIQEGREDGQGVGYLDDGTMVVVQDGNEYLGVELDTMVTKVLQTAAGRMIFAKPLDH